MARKYYYKTSSGSTQQNAENCTSFTCAGYSTSMGAGEHYRCQGHRATDTSRNIDIVHIEQYKEENRREQQEGTNRPPNYVIKYDQIESIRAKIKDELTARRNSPLYKNLTVVDNTNVRHGDIVKASTNVDPKALGTVIKSLARQINEIKITNPLKTTNTITGDYEPGKSNVGSTGYSTEDHYSDVRPEEGTLIEASDMGEVDPNGTDERPRVHKRSTAMSGRTQNIVQGCICHSDCFDFWFVNEPDPCSYSSGGGGGGYTCGCNYGVVAWGGCSWMVVWW